MKSSLLQFWLVSVRVSFQRRGSGDFSHHRDLTGRFYVHLSTKSRVELKLNSCKCKWMPDGKKLMCQQQFKAHESPSPKKIFLSFIYLSIKHFTDKHRINQCHLLSELSHATWNCCNNRLTFAIIHHSAFFLFQNLLAVLNEYWNKICQ